MPEGGLGLSGSIFGGAPGVPLTRVIRNGTPDTAAAVTFAPSPPTSHAKNMADEQRREALCDLRQPPAVYNPPRRKDPAGLRESRSLPSLSHRLSHRLSTTFGNPTVVHRPNLRVRPSLEVARREKMVAERPDGRDGNPQDLTDPSSYNTSDGRSAIDPSTAKTSLLSSVASWRSSAKGKDKADQLASKAEAMAVLKEEESQGKQVTSIDEVSVLTKPSIVTVETTAAAKIFFETHFSSILSGQTSPRAQRMQDLELKLQAEPMSTEQISKERNEWVRRESEYLRQTRILKTRTNSTSMNKGISVAGYEVVKVLGKGSFGVVRLVRENGEMLGGALSSLSPPQADQKLPKDEMNGFKKTTIEAIRSTIDTKRSPRKKELGNVKKEVYAMKVIRKSDMLRNSQEGHLRAERDFLVASEKSRWVVPLVASFQDISNLYLVMDYMVGGDFLGLLIRKEILNEDKTRWYVAEMILCVEEAHRLRWIHRDIKPDNFLISASGHLKISDFGLAFDGHWSHDQSYFNQQRYSLMDRLGIKVEGDSLDRKEGQSIASGMKLANILTGGKDRHEKQELDDPDEAAAILQWRNRNGKRRLARSVVGTSQYMAPEVIRGEPYDGRCDWWSIGIILYEVIITASQVSN